MSKRLVAGPDDQRPVAVDQRHRHALVARRIHPALVRLGVGERAPRQQFRGFQVDRPEARAPAVAGRPAVQGPYSAPELPYFGLRSVLYVAFPIVRWILVGIALLFEPENGGVQLAARPARGLPEYLRHGSVLVLQRVEGQSVLAVLVVEHPCELVDPAPVPPSSQAFGDLRGQLPVFRWGQSVVCGPKEQVEQERNPVAIPDRQHLVRAVRVERG